MTPRGDPETVAVDEVPHGGYQSGEVPNAQIRFSSS